MQHFAEFNDSIIDVRLPKQKEGKKSAIAYVELKNEVVYEVNLNSCLHVYRIEVYIIINVFIEFFTVSTVKTSFYARQQKNKCSIYNSEEWKDYKSRSQGNF